MAYRDSNFTAYNGSLSQTVAVTVVAGDVILVITGCTNGPTTINLPTDDDAGNPAYTAIRLDGPTSTNGGFNVRAFWTTTTATGTLTITQTLSANSFGWVTATSLGGRNTSAPITDHEGLEQLAVVSGTDVLFSSSPAALDALNGDDIVALTIDQSFDGTGNLAAGTNFIARQTLNDNGVNGMLATRLNVSAGAIRGLFSTTKPTNGSWITQAIAVAASSGGGGSLPFITHVGGQWI
jgi:hypothetical protein